MTEVDGAATPHAVARTGTAQLIDLRAFAGEPMFLDRVRRLERTSRPAEAWILVSSPLAFVVLGASFLMWRSPTLDGVSRFICGDAVSFLQHYGAKVTACRDVRPAAFAPSRDVASFLAAAALGLTPFVMWRQWRAYEAMLSGMAAKSAISSSDEAAINRHVNNANATITKLAAWAPLTMLVCATAVLALMVTEAHFGVFHLFSPQGVVESAWAHDAYSGWWAAVGPARFGPLYYFLVGTVGVYLVAQQNLVGIVIIRQLWKARSALNFGADPLNADGYYGWLPVRQALSATFAELILHGIALAAVGVVIPFQTVGGPYLFVLGQWLIMLPLHLSFPFVFVRPKIIAWKRDETMRLETDYAHLPSTLADHERLEADRVYASAIARVRAVPVLPFRRPRDVVLFLLSLGADTVTTIGVVWWLVSALT